jgi:16S rRNA (adenine1518-N6/adenine1519-N6)-dimethyltransferase
MIAFNIAPKKRFGQNFLVDPHKADSLVNALDIKPGETILEIGPGTGILTDRILKAGANLTAVELDRELLSNLENRFGGGSNFRLIESDIIKINPRELGISDFKVIGNLPYNISGAIVEWFIEYQNIIKFAVITVQKEVAARLKANPNSRDYGALSIMAQSYFNIKRVFDIPPGSFSPKPKVYSTVLTLTPDKKIGDINYPSFRDFVRACFSQKRKKLVNSLAARGLEVAGKSFNKDQIENYLARLGKKGDIRAEQLSLRDFLELYQLARD